MLLSYRITIIELCCDVEIGQRRAVHLAWTCYNDGTDSWAGLGWERVRG